MNHNYSHNYSKLLDDYSPSSGMSEVDGLSDSDWLDIASNRESDDNDSVISGDSSSENMGLTPVSRRSSISIGSSRDEDIDAWEGFVEELGDEEAQNAEPATAVLPSTAVMAESAMTASETTASAMHDPVEEQRVNEALDQSMISTLSASRSSTASAHGSIRDLRLSFPDPLTSSQNELNRSYENVPQSDTMLDIDVLVDETNDVDHSAVAIDPFGLYFEEDVGLITSIPAVAEKTLDEDKTPFEVVLYGSPSSIKWSFVSALVEKGGLVSGHALVEALPSADHHTRFLQLRPTIDDPSSDTYVIPVYDKTGDIVPSPHALVKRPSLAVVYLPLTMRTPVAADHTLYLPVLVPSSLIESSVSRDTAERDWDALSIPNDKVAHLNIDTEYPIFDGSNAEDIRDMRAHRLLQRLLSVAKKRSVKVMSDHISPAQAVTFFALMSLIVGFAMNTAFRKSTAPTPTVTTFAPVSTFWGIFGLEINHTSVPATTARVNTPIMTTHKEFSLSVFNPGSTSLSITSNSQLTKASPSATHAVVESHCKPPTWTDKVKSAKDIIVRPVIQLSAEAGPTTTVATQTIEASRLASKTTSMGLDVESLSQALDERMARLRNEYRVDELIESLDDLARAIRRQTLYRVGKAKEIRDQVQYRHERARGKAKEIKKKGEEIIYLAGTELVEKTNMAKKTARDITTYLAKMESWRTYQKAHADWVSLLKKRGHEGSNIRHRKENVKDKKSMKSSGHCGLFSCSLTDFYLA
ncbi:hypothetical protein C0989_008914 [Termitomyces sp. Mn162]|nr:hypothetical protein C0989_008914 [Termitomyces sp. Mn162]